MCWCIPQSESKVFQFADHSDSFIDLVLSNLRLFLESGLYYLESYVLNNKTADYDPVVTLIYSVNHLGFGVEIITLGLFVPYFWKTLNKPIEAEYSISIAMNRIPHKKWGMFITSILIFFVSGLFFQNVNPYGDFIGLNLA